MGNDIELKKIQLKLASGEVLNCELICYFELVNTGKKYIFYTQNETVENGLVKMYVSEVSNADNALMVDMAADEWTNLKSVMKSMLTENENPNVKYLEWED